MRLNSNVVRGVCFTSLLMAAGCFRDSYIACRRDPITGSEQCQPTGGLYGDAAATAVVAAVTYAVVGCTINGCPMPDVCSQITKRCEHSRCSETRNCPSGYSCDLDTKLCR